MQLEVWADVYGCPGYKVSNLGTLIGPDGKARAHCINGRGYVLVTAKSKHWPLHRLMLLSFYGPDEYNRDACHNNGIKTDNRLSNLRWDTRRGNLADRNRHGTAPIGSRNGKSKLTEADVARIKSSPLSHVALARELGVVRSVICQIRKGRSWKHAY